MIEFNATKEEYQTIRAIVYRALELLNTIDASPIDKQSLVMDIEAAHCNGNPLDLQGLLDAKAHDFGHDVFGIASHIDRKTGELLNCFSPRHSLKQ